MSPAARTVWGAIARIHGSVAAARGSSPRANFEQFVETLTRRIAAHWDNVVVITGEPGVGKSSLGLQVATAAEPAFDVIRQTAFSSDDIFRLYSELTTGQVLLYDEAVLGMLARGGGRNEETDRLIQALSIVRAKGITAICCIPDLWILDSFVRTGRAKYWVHVYDRGRGKVHRAWTGAKYRRPSKLPYDSWDAITPLGFRNIDRSRLWRTYYAHKMERIQNWLLERAQDPSGKISTCPRCGFKGTKFNVAQHRCPGTKGAVPPSGTGPKGSVGA